MVQSSPRASTPRIARCLRVPHTRVWTLHAEGMYPYHVQWLQNLWPGDLLRGWNFASGSLAFASCIVTSCLLTNRNGVNNTHNSHVWADGNPHAIVESNFQQHFSVNMWYAVLDDQLIGPFIVEGQLMGEAYLRFLQEELPRLLEDVPLNKRGRMYFQHDGSPLHSSHEVRNFLNYLFSGRWIRRGGPHNWPARSLDSSPLDVYGDGWRNWFTVWRW